MQVKYVIRVREIKLSLNEDKNNIKNKIAKKIHVNERDILDYTIIKESIDARKKPDIMLVYEVAVTVTNEDKVLSHNKDLTKYIDPSYEISVTGTNKIKRPIIVGAGPGGLFAAYLLAELGYNPIVIERGEKIEDRVKSVEEFWKTGKLNPNSNVQFGEGGAGTFSDGKLNTLVRDVIRQKKVFEIFVENGANSEILYRNKPHLGTDELRNIIISIRNHIISKGGEFRYSTKLTDLIIEDNKLKGRIVNDIERIDTDICILAIGHSSRDTFYMLNNYLTMEQKPFALGIRIMHPQKDINISQYGFEYSKYLGNADYKLTHHCQNGKSVYTFCMCPGGFVVNASSEENRLAINGMSNHARDEENANSAVVVNVNSEDFGNTLFAGLEFQRKLEEKAYSLGKGKIPVTLFSDYLENKVSTNFKSINPVFKGATSFSNLNEIFPDNINEALKEGTNAFANKIPIYNHPDSILAGVETRTSSPIRIVRNEELVSNITGIYPCGEGAGYAGGITSAAMDGLKVVEEIVKNYKYEQ